MRAMVSQPFFQACRDHIGLNAWLMHSSFVINGEQLKEDVDHLLALNAFVERQLGRFQLIVNLRKDWIQVIANGDELSFSHSANQSASFLRVVRELKTLLTTTRQIESGFHSVDPLEKLYHSMYHDIPVLVQRMKLIKHPDFQPRLDQFIQKNYSLEAFFELALANSRDEKLLDKIREIDSDTLKNLFLIEEYFFDVLDQFGEDVTDLHFEHVSNIPIEYHCLHLIYFRPKNNLNNRIKAGDYVVNWRDHVVKTMNNAEYAVQLITK